VKLCLVGCGEHAVSSHAPAQARYAAAHPGTVLAACCDVDERRADAVRAKFRFARAYRDALNMLEAERPDAAALVVPPEKTAELAARILERGVPLLIEKPPGRTVAELDGILAAAGDVPHQVAFNRRFAPLVVEARRRLATLGPASAIQHVHYEMTRVNRREPDFSITAIHGLDAVRFLADADYVEARFRYHEMPARGPGVANAFVDAVLSSGATAHLAFCPVGGVVAERATIHAAANTLFLQVPMWGAFDSPGRLQHVEAGRRVADVAGDEVGLAEPFLLGGFYGEYEAFLGALAEGRRPSPSLAESRQSVALADCLRRRDAEFHA
jgi:predicted dehydrogenase